MVNSIERMRKRSSKESCEKRQFKGIVVDATSFCIMKHIRNNYKEIEVNLMFKSKEFADDVFLYTKKEDDVKTGDYLEYKNDIFFTTYELRGVKIEEHIKRFAGIKTNVAFFLNSAFVRGFLLIGGKSSAQSQNDKELGQRGSVLGLTFDTDAMLILPSEHKIKIAEDLVIGGRQWRIKQFDNITNEGITYISLDEVLKTLEDAPVLFARATRFAAVDEFIPSPQNDLISGNTYSFETETGHFKSDKTVDIIAIKPNKVTIKIPFGIDSLNIEVKEYNKIVNKIYKVGS